MYLIMEGVFFSGVIKYDFMTIRRISKLHELDLHLLPGTSRNNFVADVYGGILNFTERNITGAPVSKIDL